MGEAAALGAPFHNRLRKRYEHLRKAAKRLGVTCYRVYDADIPEFNLAVDLYENRWAVVQEYQAPPDIDPAAADARRDAAVAAVPAALGVAPGEVFFKMRQRQRGAAQYEKQNESRNFHVVSEAGMRFAVNFEDYLDTGLFLDHRDTRALIGQRARGARFLNLFAYTATATVHAAKGGARHTTSVDLSNTYLSWARRNFELNDLRGDNELVRGDCLQWVREARPASYDLIFLDPPTFSTSKSMSGTLDIQRDHVALISSVSRLLSRAGTLIFSTNRRRFDLDRPALEAEADVEVEDITKKTIPFDFERRPDIHQVYVLRRS